MIQLTELFLKMQNEAMTQGFSQSRFGITILLAGALLFGQIALQEHFYDGHGDESDCLFCASSDVTGPVESSVTPGLPSFSGTHSVSIYADVVSAFLFPHYLVRAPPLPN